jgi:superfamily I DNA/RNA helicase
LVPTNPLARTYAAAISELGLACRTLDKYDGTPSSEVKVGTFKRAKGLEFKHVLIPRAEPGVLRDAALTGEDNSTHEERLDRTRRELFVAVTRARDTVWIGHVGDPSALLGHS